MPPEQRSGLWKPILLSAEAQNPPLHIDFKILLRADRVLQGLSPSYLSDLAFIPRTLQDLPVAWQHPLIHGSVGVHQSKLKTRLYNRAFNWIVSYSLSLILMCSRLVRFYCFMSATLVSRYSSPYAAHFTNASLIT